MAYTLSNKGAKNLCKRTVLLQLIIKNVVTRFFGTQCIIINSDFIRLFNLIKMITVVYVHLVYFCIRNKMKTL